ncbi:hypothetical protein TSOC_006079 [Tetrabaena socialis]|uniref:Uncharacterized protein n=1 Tax=Tetrabaena socialis TaxID=47790 RepID=A0A2J8A4L4_9CHLO|nr:hypothetical protein TSOC_006079 [Tetrabaena socialis]|eukprot:PNH07445.1 hypothetical protein TSOC_006079 [Tetrabaena socialis]
MRATYSGMANDRSNNQRLAAMLRRPATGLGDAAKGSDVPPEQPTCDSRTVDDATVDAAEADMASGAWTGPAHGHGATALRSALSQALRLVAVLRAENAGLRDQLAGVRQLTSERDHQLEELREVCELYRSHRDTLVQRLAHGSGRSGGDTPDAVRRATSGEPSPATPAWLSSLLPQSIGQWMGGGPPDTSSASCADSATGQKVAVRPTASAATARIARATPSTVARPLRASLMATAPSTFLDTCGPERESSEGGFLASELPDSEDWSLDASPRPSPRSQRATVSGGDSSGACHPCRLLRARSITNGVRSELCTQLFASPAKQPPARLSSAYNWRRSSVRQQSEPRLPLGCQEVGDHADGSKEPSTEPRRALLGDVAP